MIRDGARQRKSRKYECPPLAGGITDEGWSLLAGLGVELAALGAVLFTLGVYTGLDLLGALDVGGHDGVVGDRVPMSESTYRFGMYVPGSKADALVPICHILFDCQSALFR